ncbi:hypothetical protein XELAEV_18041658mg [Xenopus laevis]|uniref:Uncharacterized protein n=1 Tax=Xenopus laevis TaxID=8355 RepID=A0A974H5B0_XENLA|nr:hypothetical protein XELAEV_18041658mg [Xenopus laevis]
MALMIVSETNTLSPLCCFREAEPSFSLAKSLALWNPKEIECFTLSAGTAPSFPLRVSSATDSASSLESSSSSAGPRVATFSGKKYQPSYIFIFFPY